VNLGVRGKERLYDEPKEQRPERRYSAGQARPAGVVAGAEAGAPVVPKGILLNPRIYWLGVPSPDPIV
jgi:hypothetical protein